ncbi:hypothetical protein CcaverHIS002_0113150 [Cutaneotrichosporon cavernicola]|uniref:DUF2804 domain-containing protein n=1 Tax=Cutaneotrichosporon cavernicola TaxID=279322 RepID=A0AA48HZU0_9TREE|nr:uncharacterized protein CcaverHIS019_0113020 [Cutaneotrichosporon cavernicola]BEI80786.1 hypothetical protein CcaverHIS002_0113150 [Cutaneotrichosporon cavernicola]BEI88584.1 hypothetical protein CcaverHIS019_0113020 [Cutaneotrichosporon cavernicola]BEI96357.1 hypothetical protein CcaverHIS631_0113060 [Cutaneotrichosporon cavernicola]BEJ04129.1 hypothetical protein CcaverHIS641_0113040 [Cutaneotrichosporon cavernicola]
MRENELTSPVSLTRENKFNRAAHGWARQPIVDTSGIHDRKDNLSWGSNKRWEYWCVMTPTHILACTIASLDFLSSAEVWIFDRATNEAVLAKGAAAMGDQGAQAATLPAQVESGPATYSGGGVEVCIEQVEGGTRIRASAEGGGFDILAARPLGHERLAVVVPWSDDLFQYTVKDVSRPASGTVTVGGVTTELEGESWAVLDHGRGRWPSSIQWNWGAGCGRATDGRAVGLQVGDKWTDGTGSTENSFLLNGRLYKISEKLKWEYDLSAPLERWRVYGAGLNATLTPFYDKFSKTDAKIVRSRTDQCFGIWEGSFDTGSEVVRFTDVIGFAEDVERKW